MQFADAKILMSISEQLSGLARYVTIINGSGLYDINKNAENFFCNLLNLGGGLNLKNMNSIQTNYPAIDLGDVATKICVQITSENSSTKLADTLRKFEAHKLGLLYDNLIFLVISDKPIPNLKSLPGLEVEVWNVAALVTNITVSADSAKLNRINDFLLQNIKSSVTGTASFLPSMLQTHDFGGNCNALLLALGFSGEPESAFVVEDVRELYSIIQGLTSDERGFMYTLLRWGADAERGTGYYGNDYTFSPIATIEPRVGGQRAAYNFYQSLQSFNLVSVENEYQPDQDGPYVPVYSAKFYGKSEINILTAIRNFCNGNDGLLRRVITQAEFELLC